MNLLGDGNTLLIMSWSHAMTDGARAILILNTLAGFYRGASPFEPPVADRPRKLWPKDLKAFLATALDIAGCQTLQLPDFEPQDQEDLYTPGPFAFGNDENVGSIMRPLVYPGYNGADHVSVTVHVTQADLQALKAQLKAHPSIAALPYISTNDIVSGLAWLLTCDARGRQRPGQKTPGALSSAFVMVNMVGRSLPAGLIPPGYVGNLTEPIKATCTSRGLGDESPDEPSCLFDSLGHATAAVRTAVLEASQPSWGMQQLAAGVAKQSSQGYAAFVDQVAQADGDTRITNWNTFDNQLDFGTGQGVGSITGFLRIAGIMMCCVVRRFDGDGVGIRMELPSWEGYGKLLASPVLPALAPSSGVPRPLQAALQERAREAGMLTE